MKVPTWGVYIMAAGSAVGLILLGLELARRGWPDPLST